MTTFLLIRHAAHLLGGDTIAGRAADVHLSPLGTQQARERHRDECIAMVSHGDVIKGALAYWLGVPLDLFLRIEIGLASVSVVAIGDYGPWVLCVNNTVEIAMPTFHTRPSGERIHSCGARRPSP